ncbi:DUF3617 domain-containing protein [Pleionea mediterranea]|uniref:Uncharacterized protein DUF3617 n=1 Tax=Pleionea mediterranea TaxID=523701 RepID=A0A316G8G3_9GAMM|nr:DUF3617 family protein [Pleionea mediterranea]PWK50757.1 uncharacterized protein DUF3617 [Pleionea mediterranea]
MRYLSIAIIVSSVLINSSAFSAELPINPGLWETTMTRTDPISGTPITETSQECVKQTSFDPADLVKEMKECKTITNELNGNTLTFNMKCDMAGASASVEGQFQSSSTAGSGNMAINMNMAGMVMAMNMDWTTKRIGDCN